MTYIGGNAFYGVVLDTLYNDCQMRLEGGGKMRHLIIGNSVTSIANSAYCGPSSGGGDTILESVVLGSSVTSIGDHAFRYCKRLDSIAIPSNVTSIGMYAFGDCSSLSSVTIPSNSSLGTIGQRAFVSCTNLKVITLPYYVTSIGTNAFYGVRCVIYPGYNSISGSPWGAGCVGKVHENGFVYSNLAKTSLVAYIGDETAVVIPATVNTIEEQAFSGDTNITSVVISKQVLYIGIDAFKNCTGLTSVTYNARTCNIFGTGASFPTIFQNCPNVTSFTFGDSIQYLPYRLFVGLTGLHSVILPEGLTSIPDYAFYECTGLTSVTLPSSITGIYTKAFYNCTNLTSINIPCSTTSIFNDAFYGCSALTEVHWNANINNFQINNLGGGTNISSVVIGDSVRAIPDNFCYALHNLTTVTMGNGVTSIGVSAFAYCDVLHSVTLGSGIATIGTSAFLGCTALTETHYNGTIAQWLAIDIMGADGNPIFYSHNFYLGDSLVTKLHIPEGVTAINGNFRNDTALTHIYIPSTVTSISYDAFSGWTALTETHYNGTIEQWLAIDIMTGGNPISYSHNLYFGDSLVTKLHIPEGVTAINDNFRNDTALTHIYIPSTVTSISSYAFNGCAPSWFYFKPATPPALASWQAFTYTTSSGQTYGSLMMVPWQSLQAYKTATNYTSFAQNLIYPDSCMLSVNINNTTLGTATLDGSSTLSHLYQLLDTATIVVTPTGNFYAEVTADGCTIIDTINANTYKVRFNRSNAYPTFTVNFIGNTHHVNAVANCANCGTVTGTNDYAYGATVTVEATAADGYYFVRWADGSTANPATFVCTGDTTVTAIFSDVVTPELCMVSVQNDRNVLLWEREDKPIVSYTVYREGTVSGEYDAITTITYAQAGEWTDNDSRPSSRSYRYRLTATDTCGNESEAGGIHKTMHLTISQGIGNSWNLVWTEYQGT